MSIENSNKLDLTIDSKLSVEDSKYIDDNLDSIIELYNKFVMRFIKEHNISGVMLLFSATCRNSFDSKLFDYFCRFHLLEHKIYTHDAPGVINVDDSQLGVVKYLIDKSGLRATIRVVKKTKSKPYFIFKNIAKSLYFVLIDFIFPKLVSNKNVPDAPIIYIDNFMSTHDFYDGDFVDRFFYNHKEYISKKTSEKEWFAPPLMSLRVNKSKHNFLIQESWLTAYDFLYSFVYAVLAPSIFTLRLKYKKVTCYDRFMINLIAFDIGSVALMRAVYRYRFIRRLSIENVEVESVVNWYENQTIDRAINLAFRKFYKGVTVKGYQGFPVLRSYPAQQPTCYENDLNTVPHQLHVISDYYKKEKKSICNNLDVRVSPAFRYAHLFDFERVNNRSKYNLLVIFPGIISECDNIVKAVLYLLRVLDKKYAVQVKIHPQYSLREFEDLVSNFSKISDLVTISSIPELLPSTDLVLSSGSSASVEAVAVGIPVIICANPYGATHNFIPEFVPHSLYRTCYTNEEIEGFIIKVSLDSGLSEKSLDLNDFFCKPNEILTKNLFE